MKFTPEQQAALDLHVHCAVHANAGSGKTSVVTHRYVKILVETTTPLDQIIAITFTRAAAAEMRERIHRLLIDAERSPNVRSQFNASLKDEELCRQLRQWSSTISSARISTFHSFCAGLVRQYSEELELDSDIRDLDASEAASLVDDAVRRAITAHLAPNAPYADELMSVFDDVPIDTVRKIVAHATRDSSFAEVLTSSTYDRPRHRRRERVQSLTRVIARDTIALFADILSPLSDIPSIALLLDAAQKLALRCADPNDECVTSDVLKLYESAFTKDHGLRAAVIPKELRATIEYAPVVPLELKSHLTVLSAIWDDVREQRFDDIITRIHGVVQTSREHYRSTKRERNVIDFDDMIHLTLELLNDDSIVQALRKSIRYIMVDEFQDTDPLQYEVLSRIAPALRGEDAPTPNVYIVGDDKQSIYGFRDADVRLFRRATYALQCANAHRGSDTGYRPLVTSFRMHERLAHSVNAICSSMFGAVATPSITDTTSFDVGYQPLRSVPSSVTSDHVGTCTVVLASDDESQAVANLVGNILSGRVRRDIHEFSGGAESWTVRAPQPSDIAVLVQNNAQIVAIGEALARLRIPADLSGGTSYFSRPEINDIRALLTACISPSDNLAVAALCRSPLLRCVDADLATAALVGRRSSLRDGIAQCAADGSASESLLRAHAMLTRWEELSIRKNPIELIQHALDESQWYATLEQEDRRDQILANVEKAFEMVRSAVDGTGGTLYDAVTALTPNTDDRERDGFVPTNVDAVRVMTIHASKGLEFGIVIVAGLSSSSNSDTYLSTEPLGVTFSLSTSSIDPIELSGIAKLAPLASHVLAKNIQTMREMAETRRRLYVALTRAKAHLHILMSSDEITGDLPGMGGVLGRALVSARSHVGVEPDVTAAPFEHPVRDRNELILLDHIPAQLPSIVAPTQFLEVHHWAEGDRPSQDGAMATGAAFGIALHDTLAAVLPDVLDVDHDQRLRLIARSLALHQLDRASATEAALEIAALLETTLVAAHTDLLRKARREVHLVGALDDVVLQGIIDCRLMHPDGTISVWDWKTNSVRDEADLDERARQYHRQMQSYAWLCFRAYPDCTQVTTRLVFTKAIVRGLASYDRSRQWHRSQMPEIEQDIRSALSELLTRSNS